jgi:hypothetical protein
MSDEPNDSKPPSEDTGRRRVREKTDPALEADALLREAATIQHPHYQPPDRQAQDAFSELESGLGRALEQMAELAVHAVREKHVTLEQLMRKTVPFDGNLGEAVPNPAALPIWKLKAARIGGLMSVGDERPKAKTGPLVIPDLLLAENGEWWSLLWVGRWENGWAYNEQRYLEGVQGALTLVEARTIDDWFVPAEWPFTTLVTGLDRAFMVNGPPEGQLAERYAEFRSLCANIGALVAPREVIRTLKWLRPPIADEAT